MAKIVLPLLELEPYQLNGHVNILLLNIFENVKDFKQRTPNIFGEL